MAVDSKLHCPLQELYLHGKYEFLAMYLVYYILLFPIICNRKLPKRLKLQFSL